MKANRLVSYSVVEMVPAKAQQETVRIVVETESGREREGDSVGKLPGGDRREVM